VSGNLSEAAVCRIVHRVEDLVIKVPEFHLPGKKKLREGSTQFAVVVVDATESPVERPQKNSAATPVARSGAIRRRLNSLSPKAVGRFSARP
jgi:type IV secretory pathway VirD2 relaxase